MNWYTYAGNNPLRFVDPTGMTADENENNDFYTIPTFVPFKYNNNALDWLKAVPNACTYMVNDAIGLANAAIVDVQYIKKRGIRNYLGVAWEQTKQQASNIGASVKNTIAYHVNTPPAEQLSDAKDVLSNPDTWARASATAGEMYLAGKAMKSLGKSKVKSGGNKAGIKGAKASSNSKTAATKTDFYVTPSGEAIPSTGYRYGYGSPDSMVIKPGRDGIRYISFTRYDTALAAKEGLQLPQMPTWRATFDTLQIIDDLRIPYKEWNTITGVLEPIAQSMDKWGVGGGTQAITSSSFLANEIKIFSTNSL